MHYSTPLNRSNFGVLIVNSGIIWGKESLKKGIPHLSLVMRTDFIPSYFVLHYLCLFD